MNLSCGTSKVTLLDWSTEVYPICSAYPPAPILTMVSLYGVTFLASLLANSFLIFALSKTSKSIQIRNNIVFSQCISDLLVTLVCMPDTVAARLLPSWEQGEVWCRLSPLVNTLAITASTYSLMMLSLDRCLAMKNTKMFNQGRRSRLGARMTTAVWITAAVVSAPLPFVFTVERGFGSRAVCVERWPWPLMGSFFHGFVLFVVVLVPCGVITVCHALVSKNLRTANGLAAKTANSKAPRSGDMRLTGTSRSRPQNGGVIIMSKIHRSGQTPKVVQCDEDSGDHSPEVVRLTPEEEYKGAVGSSSKFPRRLGLRRFRKHCGQQNKPRSRPPLLRSTSSYSLKTRQQLANTLVILVLVFASCWLPYTLLGLVHLCHVSRFTEMALPFALLLGHAHSAVNPVVYGLVHRASFMQVQRSLRVPTIRPRAAPATPWRRAVAVVRGPPPRPDTPPSSTNLGNLGPFHPKYLPARNMLRPVEIVEEGRTSHFFH